MTGHGRQCELTLGEEAFLRAYHYLKELGPTETDEDISAHLHTFLTDEQMASVDHIERLLWLEHIFYGGAVPLETD